MAYEVKESHNTEECVEIFLSDDLQTKNQGKNHLILNDQSEASLLIGK